MKHSIKKQRTKKQREKEAMSLDRAFMTLVAECMIQETSVIELTRPIGTKGYNYHYIFQLYKITDKDGKEIDPRGLLAETEVEDAKIIELAKLEAKSKEEEAKEAHEKR